jgi:hypothetical protein
MAACQQDHRVRQRFQDFPRAQQRVHRRRHLVCGPLLRRKAARKDQRRHGAADKAQQGGEKLVVHRGRGEQGDRRHAYAQEDAPPAHCVRLAALRGAGNTEAKLS